ncbi:hypothetical protein C5Y96_14880 [Blastopirellula marina]|uniref:Uncharacterized protein n=1 Tax=Blastopirellula marina TaxID=124 RepID=A0A2S8FEY6_9BACT|nr:MULTISPECIES: acetolactate decarboxylase [Pirellulaceae]PQO30741.1 hypothetical protein C5Y96_14880 [Blastopirellula marina]RCS50878.1 hypothetical protein DTL36_14890 [Bremerella cremea]
MKIPHVFVSQVTLLSVLLLGVPASAGENDTQVDSLVQYGTMHEAIGQQQAEGRVRFSELTRRPHFYGVAALEGLHGEGTIYDGKVTITTVDESGNLQSNTGKSPDAQATMLVGSYIPSWTQHEVTQEVPPSEFDRYIENAANQAGLKMNEPFVFTIEGDFSNVDLHVINGACPIHARMKKIELPKDRQPFEAEIPAIDGKLVGIFAKDAVGKLTHPATSTHIHLLYSDPKTGKTVTGHIEKIGLQKGAVLRLPEN